ncbi:hypothetical protein E2C01_069247 [Portunus trituberculatus]|uniref:Uncharacterized protein n=1 Tax=Portunus trituberculatus TaxID=210409 RepID=A0A5B7HYU5_PORTR|nr:hypothetical protein [Portunus trituberculatus]
MSEVGYRVAPAVKSWRDVVLRHSGARCAAWQGEAGVTCCIESSSSRRLLHEAGMDSVEGWSWLGSVLRVHSPSAHKIGYAASVIGGRLGEVDIRLIDSPGLRSYLPVCLAMMDQRPVGDKAGCGTANHILVLFFILLYLHHHHCHLTIISVIINPHSPPPPSSSFHYPALTGPD